MNADGGMVSIALLIILVVCCIAGFTIDQLVYKPRRLREENKSHRVITGTAQEFDPLAQWCSPPPGGDFGRRWYGGTPATPLAEKVLQAHLAVQALDQAVLTGTITDMDVAYQEAGYSVTKLAQQMLRDMNQENQQ